MKALFIFSLVLLFSCNNDSKVQTARILITPKIEATISRQEKIHLTSQKKSYLYYKVIFKNNSDSSIKAVKGSFAFLDKFGDPVHSVNIKSDVFIKPKDTASIILTEEFSHYDESKINNYLDVSDSMLVSKWELIEALN